MKRLDAVFNILAVIASLGLAAHISAAPETPAGTVVSWGIKVNPYVTSETHFTNIAAGGRHSLALKTDGTVVAWGDNWLGQSTVPGGLTGVVGIAAGSVHSLALKSDGTVVAWGWYIHGQSTVPAGLTNVVAVSAGGSHSLALKSDGTVAAWGSNSTGSGDRADQSIVPNGLTGVVAIAAGSAHSLALKSDGTVAAWGKIWNGATFVPHIAPNGLTGVVGIDTEDYHSLALKSDGSIVSWGNNIHGEGNVPETLHGVVAIAAGGGHSLALKSDGMVVAWGGNWYGQSKVPAGLDGIAAIAAGGEHSLALKTDGTLVGWGSNATGQLPQPIVTTQPASQVSALGVSAEFSVSVTGISPLSYQWRKDGTDIIGATSSDYSISNVQTNDAGTYSVIVTNPSGSVTSSNAVSTVEPILITEQPQNQIALWIGSSALFRVNVSGAAPLGYQWRKDGIEIDGATNSAYARLITQNSDAGSYSVAVSNRFGALTSSNALLTMAPNTVPPNPLATRTPGTVVSWGTQVIPYVAPGTRFTTIAAGQDHSLALRADGTVVAWGWAGQTAVPGGLGGVVALAAGHAHSLALKADGTVVAWGQIQKPFSSVSATVPSGLAGVVAIAAGGYHYAHSLALKSDGTVVAWENNEFGESTVPGGLTGVVAIAEGGGHSLALKSDGTVAAWGNNSSGQCAVPDGLTAVVAIAAGYAHSLALKSDGTVVAWGWAGSAVPDGLTGVVTIAAGDTHYLALVADAPALVVQASGANISLSWPLWAEGFALQSTTNLADQSSWTPVLIVPTVEASRNQVTDPISGPAKFYRLKK